MVLQGLPEASCPGHFPQHRAGASKTTRYLKLGHSRSLSEGISGSVASISHAPVIGPSLAGVSGLRCGGGGESAWDEASIRRTRISAGPRFLRSPRRLSRRGPRSVPFEKGQHQGNYGSVSLYLIFLIALIGLFSPPDTPSPAAPTWADILQMPPSRVTGKNRRRFPLRMNCFGTA